jgi:zinc protease
MTFYKAHYTPANAILVVAGDVTTDEVRKRADEHYGKLVNTFAVGPRIRTPEPEPLAARRVTLIDARVASPMIQRNYLAPSYATATGRDAYALDILSGIIGSGSSSRLYKKLVIEKRIAAYAGAWYSSDGLDSGSFGVYGAPNPGGKVEEVEAAIDEVLADILKNGVTADEVAKKKAELLAETVYARDNQGTMARAFGVALTTGSTVEQVINWPERMQEVTVDDIKAVAAKIIDLRRSATGILLPAPGANIGAAEPGVPSFSNSTQH